MNNQIPPLDYDALFALDPYSLDKSEKGRLFEEWLRALQSHHARLCEPYARIVEAFGDNPSVPVRLFKEYDLRSAASEDIAKVMTSSGTTGQTRSKIYLDRATSSRQSKALARIVNDSTGSKARLPMLVIDAEGTVKDRRMFSARTAGIRGFSMLARDITFALDDSFNPRWDVVEAFASRNKGCKCLVFGFTYIVWADFIEQARKEGVSFNLEGILVHGGGWKKLTDIAVSSSEFNKSCSEVLGEKMRSCDYYGMVEQTGSICMECEEGHLHVSIYGDVDVLDPITLQPAGFLKRGIIKSVSLLPTSYPGHILLTEDEGELLGEDDCPCGRKGRYFRVYGRQKGAELRGCSDTHEQ